MIKLNFDLFPIQISYKKYIKSDIYLGGAYLPYLLYKYILINVERNIQGWAGLIMPHYHYLLQEYMEEDYLINYLS